MNGDRSPATHCRDILRSHDRDRYLASLFAPDDRRNHLWALYAFDHEISRIRDVTSEPGLGEIRLRWWADTLERIWSGGTGEGPVAQALAGAVKSSALPRQPFLDLIEARRFDLYDDPMPGLAELEGYLGETSSAVIQLATIVLAGHASAAVAPVAGYAGIAYGICRLLSLLPLHRRRGQCYLPRDLLERHGATPRDVIEARNVSAVGRAARELANHAGLRLAEARKAAGAVPRDAFPAFLHVSLVEPYLTRLVRHAEDLGRKRIELNPLYSQWRIWRTAGSGNF